MTRPSDRSGRSRRSVLCATTALFALTAGCISDDSAQGTTDDETDGTDGDPGAGEDETDGENDGDGENGEDGDSDDDSDQYETQSLTYPEMPDQPDVEIHFDEDDVEEWLADRTPSDDRAVTEFVDETSFEDSVLISLEASAPNLCYELVIDEVTVEEESIDITAAVRDESDPDEVCAQQVTAVGQLVRATTDDDVSELSATIVAEDGTEHGFGMGFDSSEGSASESRSVSDSDSDADGGSDSDSGSDDAPA